MTDIADMQRESERRRPFRPRKEERRTFEMLVPFRAGPHRRERHHMGEIEGRDRRLTDVCIDMPWQASEPGFDGVDGLAHASEVAALDALLPHSQSLLRA